MMDGTATHSVTKPRSILICAMGGEGGGVLTGWIVAAAQAQGLGVQATSVPGVAQRTGGTTYYIEMASRDAEGRSPVFALTPVAGEVDLVVASELLEATRAARLGYVTPERTDLIASSHRVFLIQEKIAMSDGRLDPEALEKTARGRARSATFLDMEKLARDTGAPISAVMFGAIAGANSLPIERAHFEAAIRDSGIAVERNLAAFNAAAQKVDGSGIVPALMAHGRKSASDFIIEDPAIAKAAAAGYPAVARAIIATGEQRLTDYQDAEYAALYRMRLEPFVRLDPLLCREVARQLALRMSYEDVIRVAQLKARPDRYERIRGELGLTKDEPFEVQDFFKPGVREMADIMPPRLAVWLLARADNSAWLRNFYIGMKLKTTTVTGFVRILILARMRGRRRRTYRYAHEQKEIEAWLALVNKAAAHNDIPLAREIVELARLIKGYGDTHARGSANYARIVETLVQPGLVRDPIAPDLAARVRAARDAALADPEGTALDTALKAAIIQAPAASSDPTRA